MFKNIRRNSKQLISSRRRSSVTITPMRTNESGQDPQPTTPSRPRTLTFFDLPAEIRNDIYEQIAEETRILVPIPAKKASKKPPENVPSLLLASKQTRREYLPLLLAHSTLNFQVREWDFRPLIRLLGSLYSTELKSLRQNQGLRIKLWQDRLDGEATDRLRKWLVHRAQGLDRLAFEYQVQWGRYTQLIPTSTQVQKVNVFMQRRLVLGQNLGAIGYLMKELDEALQFELQPIVTVLQHEDRAVGADPQLPWTGNINALMYGMPIRVGRS